MDIETYSKEEKVIPYLFVCSIDDTYYSFYQKNDNSIIANFLELIEKKTWKFGGRVEIFTHNINFDGFILIEYFLKKSIPYKWFMREMNLYYIDFTYMGRDMKIRCSYKILGLSVKSLGTYLDIKKTTFPYKFISKDTLTYDDEIPPLHFFESIDDYTTFTSNHKTFSTEKISTDYAFRDVEIVVKSLKSLLEISNKSILLKSYSFSSYSYKLFSKKYDEFKITKHISKTDSQILIEKAYFGGRTEIFGNTKDGLIHKYDFPGMYGSCMMEKFPYGEPVFEKTNTLFKQGFYTVSVESSMKIPILPLRLTKEKVVYPNGRFIGVYTRDELLLFEEHGGRIEKIHHALVYPKEDYVFKNYVEKYNEIKAKGGFYKIYGKGVINGLYGSFALRKDEIEYILIFDEEELNSVIKNGVKSIAKFEKFYVIGREKRLSLTKREGRNLAYAAFISAKAKIKLHKNMLFIDSYYSKIFPNSYKLIYSETDEIVISLPESRIGEKVLDVCWDKIYSGGVYIAPKFYFLEGELKPKIKGISKSDYSYDEIKSAFYSASQPILFKNQLQFVKKNFALNQIYQDKYLSVDHYQKRIYSKDKLTTTPLIVNQW